jgi:hypothetical protein
MGSASLAEFPEHPAKARRPKTQIDLRTSSSFHHPPVFAAPSAEHLPNTATWTRPVSDCAGREFAQALHLPQITNLASDIREKLDEVHLTLLYDSDTMRR